MDFYKMLSEYYDEIFPVTPGLLKLIDEITPAGGRVLDVGCATGSMVRELVKRGYDAEGLEYVPELIRYDECVTIGDMHSLPYEDGVFDTVLCTGNTLAHIRRPEDAREVLGEFDRVLKKGGKAIVQILNYEMILKNKPASLPVIETENVVFERFYEYMPTCVKFSGLLKVKKNLMKSSVSLCPLTNSELDYYAYLSGLKEINLYGSFDKAAFDISSSLPLIKVLYKFN